MLYANVAGFVGAVPARMKIGQFATRVTMGSLSFLVARFPRGAELDPSIGSEIPSLQNPTMHTKTIFPI